MRRGGGSLAIADLGRLIKTIERLAMLPRSVARIAAPQITEQLAREFDEGKDPYGRPWAPLRPSTLARGRRPPPLTDKRDLRDGTKAKAGPAGISIRLGARYGFFHQVGFRAGRTRVPPRRVLPQYGLPRAWSAILTAAAKQAAREARR
jgi:hypothetical protein